MVGLKPWGKSGSKSQPNPVPRASLPGPLLKEEFLRVIKFLNPNLPKPPRFKECLRRKNLFLFMFANKPPPSYETILCQLENL